MKQGLTFDDILLVPGKSRVLPKDVSLKTKLTLKISLSIPLVSSAMDTVTETQTAIKMAREGGIGIIHKNMSPGTQAHEVEKVKRFEYGIVTNPLTVTPETTFGELSELRLENGVSTFPVVKNKKLIGIITSRDYRFEKNMGKKVKDLMTKKVITVKRTISMEKAKKIMNEHRIEKLVIVNNKKRVKGLLTARDLSKKEQFPNALKDNEGRLMVGAAVGVKDDERVKRLIEADVDVIVVDTSHGHSKNVIDAVKRYKKKFKIQVIAGNIATAEAAKALLAAGADAVKVGVGPGAICTTRIVTGCGVPQVTAIEDVSKAIKGKIPVIADGGIKYSGDIAKAIAAGADCVMLGSVFAGCEETPGEIIYLNNRKFKQYRGMGSIAAMRKGSKDRYEQGHVIEEQKLVPEGIEGIVPYKGKITELVHQLLGGLRSGMGLTGAASIRELKKKKMIQITSASLKESHPHSVQITSEAPNYP